MTLDVQFTIKNNPYLGRYIRENSNWYKILNRDPGMLRTFEEEVKANYKLRPSDRLNKALETLEMVESIMSTLK